MYKNLRCLKGKVHFNNIWRSVRQNHDLPLQQPHPDAHNDTEYTSSSKKMDIIGETPNRFIPNVDQYEFEIVILNIRDNDFDESNDEILELDIIPIHVRSIQEVLSDRQRLEYFLTHDAEIFIDIITTYELLEEKYIALESLDSVFSYENVGSTQQRAPTINKIIANSVSSCEHIVESVDGVKIEAPPEVNTQPPSEVVIEYSGTKDFDDDYENLILKPYYFTRGMLSKGRDSIQDDDHDAQL